MRHWGRLLAWISLLTILAILPLILASDILPNPMATHWGLDGRPNGSMSQSVVPLLTVGLMLIALLITGVFTRQGRPSAEAVALAGVFGGIAISLNVSVVILNAGASSWEDAADFDWWHILMVLVGAGVFGTIGYLLGKRWYPPPVIANVEAPAAVIEPGESVFWEGTVRVRWPLMLIALGLLPIIYWPGWGWLIGAFFLLLAILMMRVDAVVDDDGLTVKLGGFLPVRRYAVEKLRAARAIDLDPTAWGGWGWRATPSASAIVLRRGDAIELTLKTDRRFAVTVDDAATGAALLNGLVVRAGQP
jgi:hypothetical protein